MNTDVTAPKNPHRRPDWRIRRAASLVAINYRPSRRHDDPETRAACGFLRDCSGCFDEEWRKEMYRRMHLHVGAFRLHKSDSRTVIEARVLAGQPSEQIAMFLGYASGAIQIYKDLFFDVESRLGNPDFILGSVIGIGRNEIPHDEKLLKLVGYLGGSDALNQLLFTNTFLNEPSRESLNQAFVENAQTEVKVRIWRAAQLLNPTDDTKMRQLLTRMISAWERSATKPDPRSAQYDSFLENVEACLSGVELTMASDAKKDVPPEIRKLEEEGIELRADDQDILAAQGKLPDERLKHYQGTRTSISRSTGEAEEGDAK